MQAKHTAGPWELRPDDMGGLSPFIYPVGSEYPVAVVTGYHSSAGQRLPNARLIAAAPELLEALRHCEEVFMRYEINRIDGEQISDRALSVIHAAIDKATQ